jgi:predicted 3-demethylubiquinone-9 3-methyltransferase (glyoxalase superfamily)
MSSGQKITTYLWFNGNAEEAVEFYTSVFPDSRVSHVARWGEGGPGPQDTVMNIAFELADQAFIALNGGPQFTFTPAMSLFVACESQAEVDDLWTKLLSGGGKHRVRMARRPLRPVVASHPDCPHQLMSDPDPKASGRVAQTLVGMQKIDLDALRRAHAAA